MTQAGSKSSDLLLGNLSSDGRSILNGLLLSTACNYGSSYQALMPLGSTLFNVQTQPYAYVAISKDGILLKWRCNCRCNWIG